MYSIESVTIHKHKLLTTNGFTTLTIKPDSPFQIILGTNGSGKSVLMEQLLRMVPNSNEYLKDGYYHCIINKSGTIYELKSTYDKQAGHHSFEVNGQQLNDGRTATVQRTLVKDHFGLTEDLIELLLNEVRFTDMASTQRRQWIMKISNAQLDYAMKLYNQYRREERDLKGAIKHVSNEISAKTIKLSQVDSLENMEKENETLTAFIEKILRTLSSDNTSHTEYQLQQSIDTHCSNLTTLQQEVKNLSRKIASHSEYKIGQSTYEPLVKIANELPVTIQHKHDHIIKLQDELYEVNEKLSLQSEGDNTYSYDDLKELLDRCTAERAKVTEPALGAIVNILKDHSELSRQIEYVVSTIRMLPLEESWKFSTSEFNARLRDRESVIDERENALETYTKYSRLINSHESIPLIVCPKCDNEFKPGVHKDHTAELKEDLIDIERRIDNLDKELQHLDEYLSTARSYRQSIESIRSDCNQSGIKHFWEWMIDKGILAERPYQKIGEIDQYRHDIDTLKHIAEIEARREGLEESMEVLKRQDTRFRDELKSRQSKLQITLDDLHRDVVSEQKRLDSISTLVYHFSQLIELKTELILVDDTLTEDLKRHIDYCRDDILTEAMSDRQVRLAKLVNEINEIKNLSTSIEEDKKTLQELKTRQKVYKTLHEDLNPTDGFISEQLNRFIDFFLARMNEVVRQVWYSGLEVLHCENEEGELNYKFPIRREGIELLVPDLVKASMGQKEILNFAFRIVTLECLGLKKMPLFADELGANFDEVHRDKIMNYIRQVIHMGEHPQVWMVSHYATLHGTFAQPDILVLNTNNVTLPDRFNEHVTIV